MKLAYFAPLPPKRTGVADYAGHLARALAAHADITFFDSAPGTAPAAGGRVLDYVARPEVLLDLPDYDASIYQFGNNPEFHGPIFQAFQAFPGPVVLHDSVLYFLMAGLSQGGMLREFLYGPGRLADFFAIEHDSVERNVLRYRQPERYPMLRRVLATAPSLIVHSETTAALVMGMGYEGALSVIPHLAYPPMLEPIDPLARSQARESLGIGPDEILLGCFGFIAPTKRFPKLFSALAQLKDRLRFKLLIVGEGQDISGAIAEYGLADCVVMPGFVDEQRFRLLLRSIDLLVNPRFPSMGETSGPQIQAMACGLPSIVSDHAWFAELPGDSVCKIGVGADEESHLGEALLNLGSNPALRAEMGAAARETIVRTCAPDIVAGRFAAVLAAEAARPKELYPDGGHSAAHPAHPPRALIGHPPDAIVHADNDAAPAA